ncbi:MAG: NAD(P)H-dependent oxidoreductase subunit E, partial [Candidatus Mariimomonas ferrooxydans]
MNRIKNILDLKGLQEQILEKRMGNKTVLRTCTSTGCRAQNAQKVVQTLSSAIEANGLQGSVEIKKTGCHGFCEMGPIMVVEPENIFYRKVKPENIDEIMSQLGGNKEPIKRLLWKDPVIKEVTILERELPLYKKQKKYITFHSGKIDPADIEDYIAVNGYSALGKALTTMKPAEVVDVVTASGLRGRGGGGFPTGVKWQACSTAPGDVKYIIANGDEGDPGAPHYLNHHS